MCFTPPMHLRIGMFTLTALMVLSPCSFGSSVKRDKVTISFHMEAQKTDNPKMIFPVTMNGQERVFSRAPEFTLKDMASFRPFPSKDNPNQFGIAIYLKPHDAKRLSLATNANQRRWLAAKVNGRTVDVTIINAQVNDSTLVIWDNLTLADIASIEKALPRVKPKTNPE